MMFSSLGKAVVFLLLVRGANGFDYPEGVQVWCGKAYRATNASFEPGGWLNEPVASSEPLLDLTIRPRTNIYTASDIYASVIVDAKLSYIHGGAYYNTSFNKQTNETKSFTTLFIDVSVDDTGLDLVSSANVTVNSTSNEFIFSLGQLEPQLEPYNLSIIGSSGDGNHSYVATTQLYYLPDRTDGGNVVKIDNLYGGLLVQDFTTNSSEWTPFFPYTYYALWDEWVGKSVDTLDVFKERGYNTIHIVPTGTLGDFDFPYSNLTIYLERAKELGLWIHWGMRGSYTNLTYVAEQVEQVKAWPNLLSWYTADEPDGNVEPLNSTKIAYDYIKGEDPWHPISMALNCENYYFEEYTSGTDIILSDVYPISVNTSWSTVYDTACNTTYGCCGCDNCEGKFEDISNRFTLFSNYQDWLGIPKKPHWGAPQAFGNETFWSRYPTVDEEIVMNMLSVNHDAKGIVMWDYPTEPGIITATGDLSKVLSTSLVTNILLGTYTIGSLPVTGNKRADASAWIVGSQMLVSIVNLEYGSKNSMVTVTLPQAAKSISSVLWGTGNWTVSGGMISTPTMAGLQVDIIVFDI
ncbi:hypothetical protein BP5796_09264 [Coleophoma crateriformis]|uniref:Glycoside hydrolase subgroup catalytic core protein n=1 Tax=Coleophoma crateriformis TaxID=565419 RepID=A0A3D8R3K5_9HELO|nr:hypothetical protein BP5796_09264 [Coleophoma crateriformis]